MADEPIGKVLVDNLLNRVLAQSSFFEFEKSLNGFTATILK
jgi:hypothetical protein